MSCAIELDKGGILYPGDEIPGKLICTFNKDENIRGIICKFRGTERTEWSEPRGKHREYFSAKEKFIVQNAVFAEQGDMQEGTYVYPFVFHLPKAPLPSSWEHKFGSIRYYIKAKVDRPFVFDYEDNLMLHVASPINFNNIRSQLRLMPVAYQIEEGAKCCWFTSQPIAINMTLEKDAFLLGEVIKAKVIINNKSKIDIESVTIQLLSNIQFKATKNYVHYRDEKETIAESSTHGVKKRTKETYDFNLAIPKMIIPNFARCTVLKHWWSVTVTACVAGCYKDVRLQAFIQLGHIPLNDQGSPMGSLTNVSNDVLLFKYVPDTEASCPSPPSAPMNFTLNEHTETTCPYPIIEQPSFPMPSMSNEGAPYPIEDHSSFPVPNNPNHYKLQLHHEEGGRRAPIATEEEIGSLMSLLDTLGIDAGLPLVYPASSATQSRHSDPLRPPSYIEATK